MSFRSPRHRPLLFHARSLAGAPQLVGEALQLHELEKSLVDRQAQVLLDQRPIDVPLVALDDRIDIASLVIRPLGNLAYRHG